MPYLTIKTHLLIVLVLALFTPPKEVLAQNEERPDFSGIWSNASRTSLSRPRNTELIVSAEQAQVIVENFCAASKNVSSPTPSKTTIKLSSSPSAHANGKTPMTAPLSIRDNFVSAPSSPADRFQTPKTSMRTTSRLGGPFDRAAASTCSQIATRNPFCTRLAI